MRILNKDKEEIEVLDLGIVEAGKSKDYVFYIENNTDGKLIDIEVSLGSINQDEKELKRIREEVEIISSPTILHPYGTDVFKLKWSPNLTLKKGLKTTIRFKGKELYK
ncbi:MAG: hypothetical protein ACOC5T_08950 [Elusimicrobiota bacterium]